MVHSEDTANRSESSRSHIRSRIFELDAHILALEESLVTTRYERENLQSQLDNYTYPILTLPVEITSEIFFHVLPVYPLRPPLTGLPSPALLGQICRRWRDIAFSTPRLWRAIQLNIEWKCHLDMQLDALATWLSRSKDCTLSISLEYKLESELCSSKLPDITEALISNAARWEYVHLIIPFLDLHWIRGPFPLLRALSIGKSNYDDGREISVASPFHDAPQLQKVVLCVLFDPSWAYLPWWQFTSISADKCEPSVLGNILSHAVSLIDFDGTLWDDDDDVPPVAPLAYLQSLILHDECKTKRGAQKLLLDALTTPALRHLTVSERELGPDYLSTITSALSRSKCSLVSLHVTHARLSHAEYRAAFPSIESISIGNEWDDEDEDGVGGDDDDE
ncbi:hypothetical protein C8J57DRAFT_1185973 [Mycena rebaudengoi]|nr:hypothetical protein C8J57DRAFT_1185973 [Mycena rebaudengoi]